MAGALVLVFVGWGVGLLRRDVPSGVRGVAIAIVSVNMVVQLAWMPAYPAWSIIVLVLDVFVLYALIVTWSPSQR